MSTVHGVALTANLRCRSETCSTRLAENAAPKESPKIRHLGTIAQFCRAISSQLRHVSTIGKNVVNSNICSTCRHNTIRWTLTAEIDRSGFIALRALPQTAPLTTGPCSGRPFYMNRLPSYPEARRRERLRPTEPA